MVHHRGGHQGAAEPQAVPRWIPPAVTPQLLLQLQRQLASDPNLLQRYCKPLQQPPTHLCAWHFLQIGLQHPPSPLPWQSGCHEAMVPILFGPSSLKHICTVWGLMQKPTTWHRWWLHESDTRHGNVPPHLTSPHLRHLAMYELYRNQSHSCGTVLKVREWKNALSEFPLCGWSFGSVQRVLGDC